MVLLRSVTSFDNEPLLEGDGVYLRVPQMADYLSWAEIRSQSRDFLSPWEPTWPRDDLTRSAFRRRLRRYMRDLREDQAYPFFIFDEVNDTLVGGATLSNVRRGVAQACSLGYWVGVAHARKGYVSAGVRAICPFVFERLGLHRLEAACLPGNRASIGLLRKTGFAEEGYARRYLQINGKWQDHLLFALLAEDPRP